MLLLRPPPGPQLLTAARGRARLSRPAVAAAKGGSALEAAHPASRTSNSPAAPSLLDGRFHVPAAEVQQALRERGITGPGDALNSLLMGLVAPAGDNARAPISQFHVG